MFKQLSLEAAEQRAQELTDSFNKYVRVLKRNNTLTDEELRRNLEHMFLGGLPGFNALPSAGKDVKLVAQAKDHVIFVHPAPDNVLQTLEAQIPREEDTTVSEDITETVFPTQDELIEKLLDQLLSEFNTFVKFAIVFADKA